MEIQVNAAGKRIYPSEFKKQILDELGLGSTAAELGRKHGIPIHNILYWKQGAEKAISGKSKGPAPEEQVPVSEYRKLLDENKNLKRSLANMTVDRDILKEAHDIAVKKKWILPAK
jgi:transposase-like protein